MPAKKAQFVIGIAFILGCILLFLAAVFAPRAIGFLDAYACPEGMQLSNRASEFTSETGSPGTAISIVCTQTGRAPVDATPRMLILLFAMAAVGGGFLIWAYGGIQRVV